MNDALDFLLLMLHDFDERMAAGERNLTLTAQSAYDGHQRTVIEGKRSGVALVRDYFRPVAAALAEYESVAGEAHTQ